MQKFELESIFCWNLIFFCFFALMTWKILFGFYFLNDPNINLEFKSWSGPLTKELHVKHSRHQICGEVSSQLIQSSDSPL